MWKEEETRIEKFRTAGEINDSTISRSRTEEQATGLSEKMEIKFEGLLKVLEKMASANKYLEKGEIQGSNNKDQNLR